MHLTCPNLTLTSAATVPAFTGACGMPAALSRHGEAITVPRSSRSLRSEGRAGVACLPLEQSWKKQPANPASYRARTGLGGQSTSPCS